MKITAPAGQYFISSAPSKSCPTSFSFLVHLPSIWLLNNRIIAIGFRLLCRIVFAGEGQQQLSLTFTGNQRRAWNLMEFAQRVANHSPTIRFLFLYFKGDWTLIPEFVSNGMIRTQEFGEMNDSHQCYVFSPAPCPNHWDSRIVQRMKD